MRLTPEDSVAVTVTDILAANSTLKETPDLLLPIILSKLGAHRNILMEQVRAIDTTISELVSDGDHMANMHKEPWELRPYHWANLSPGAKLATRELWEAVDALRNSSSN